MPENAVLACRKCNSSKGEKGVYKWDKLDMRYEVSRIVEGKYLKLHYRLHDKKGTLEMPVTQLQRLCNQCDSGKLCPEKATLTVYCLESIPRKT